MHFNIPVGSKRCYSLEKALSILTAILIMELQTGKKIKPADFNKWQLQTVGSSQMENCH